MKNFLEFLAIFILFVYNEYIDELDDTLTKSGRIILYPAYIINGLIISCLSIISFPLVSFHMMEKEKIDILIDAVIYGVVPDLK